MNRTKLEKRLRGAGCVLSQHGGSHDKWTNPETGAFDYVPRHREVSEGTARAILKHLTGE